MRYFLVVMALVFSFPALAGEHKKPIEGTALALDGDTILVTQEDGKAVRVRLWAIDAPEMNVWPWGPWARHELGSILMLGDLSCNRKGKSIGRIMAQCFLTGDHVSGEVDVGRVLIHTGYAVEHRTYGKGFYADTELKAQANGNGVWKR